MLIYLCLATDIFSTGARATPFLLHVHFEGALSVADHGVWRPPGAGGKHGTLPGATRDPAQHTRPDAGQPQPAAELRGRRAVALLQLAQEPLSFPAEPRGSVADHSASRPQREATEVPAVRRSTVAPPG